jgi:RNA polymerase sigma-70 factor (ECF subfamily)
MRKKNTGMSSRDESRTSSTLLGRLAVSPPDEAAWNEFVDRYGPRVLKWCRAHGLQDADAVDVCQSVLTVLSVRLRRFEYDRSRSFRAYLRTVVTRTLHEAKSARVRHAAPGGDEAHTLLTSVEAREDLLRRLEEEFDMELLELAAHAVRQRVVPKTWQAYDLTAREGRPSLEVAALLGMRVGAVYQAKSSVMQMLQEEVRRLEGAQVH